MSEYTIEGTAEGNRPPSAGSPIDFSPEWLVAHYSLAGFYDGKADQPICWPSRIVRDGSGVALTEAFDGLVLATSHPTEGLKLERVRKNVPGYQGGSRRSDLHTSEYDISLNDEGVWVANFIGHSLVKRGEVIERPVPPAGTVKLVATGGKRAQPGVTTAYRRLLAEPRDTRDLLLVEFNLIRGYLSATATQRAA